MGECDKKSTFEILDYFFENGGNFIDTANNYQDEESEKWIGEWAKERGVRDQLVIATKYTTFYPQNGEKIFANYQGQHAKSLRHSVDASLKKLQTEYIDLLYVHWWGKCSHWTAATIRLQLTFPRSHHQHSRGYAIAQPYGSSRKSAVPRHFRLPSMGRQQSESVRSGSRARPVCHLSGSLERRRPRHRARRHSYVP